jgi:hypothetical protein
MEGIIVDYFVFLEGHHHEGPMDTVLVVRDEKIGSVKEKSPPPDPTLDIVVVKFAPTAWIEIFLVD